MSIAEHLGRAIEKHKSKHESKKKSEPKHKIKSMEIEHEGGDGEGFIATHHYEQSGRDRGVMSGIGRYKESTKHPLKNHRDMIKHVKEHMCPDASDVEESAEEK